MTTEQNKHYIDISDALINQVDEHRPETIYRLFGALQAITSGFRISINDNGRHNKLSSFFDDPLNNPRISQLLNVLDDIGNESAVIYCRYTNEIDDIVRILEDKAIPFSGELSQKQRQENKTKFKHGQVQYFVANKSCAQFGLNLQFCHNEIFYNNDWDWGTRAQAEDRLHRAGQTRDVKIYDIYANDTLDTTILRCMARKERMSDIFKKEVASHNRENLKQKLRAALLGQMDKEEENG